MKTDRRGFIGALLALPFVSRYAPKPLINTGNLDALTARVLAAGRLAHDQYAPLLFHPKAYTFLMAEHTSVFWYTDPTPLKDRIRKRIGTRRVLPLPT